MIASPSVVVLGGGLSGMATAHTLARAGWKSVHVLERGFELGGLAGSFEQQGHFYPLGYHHILRRDRTLLYFLETLGALREVRWRKIRMLFETGGRLHDLSSPLGFLSYPMALADKLRFVRLMLRCFRKSGWTDWSERSAAELVDAWGSRGVRQAIFEPLTRLKFELSCDEVSGAWLGSRLHFREGSAPLGYIPEANWTKVLCDGLARGLDEQGVQVSLGAAVKRLHTEGARISMAELDSGERVSGDLFVSSVPTRVYLGLMPSDETPHLSSIRYTALISVICATHQTLGPDFYWMNLASLDHAACGIFQLNSLNPTIGAPGDSCINFVTHIQSAEKPFYRQSDDALMSAYLRDFREIFGFELEPFWRHISRVPMYSPIFVRGYRNPPVRSTTWRNLYFAGNYRTFPSIASTGTALASGLEAGRAILQDQSQDSDLLDEVRVHRTGSFRKSSNA